MEKYILSDLKLDLDFVELGSNYSVKYILIIEISITKVKTIYFSLFKQVLFVLYHILP